MDKFVKFENRSRIAVRICGHTAETRYIGAAFYIGGIDSGPISVGCVVYESELSLVNLERNEGENTLLAFGQFSKHTMQWLTFHSLGAKCGAVFSISYCRKQRVLNRRIMSLSIPTEAERTDIAPP